MLKIELSAEQWNAVLNILAQRPFAEVSGLIAEIQRQAAKQMTPGADETE